MSTPPTSASSRSNTERWFYSIASIVLLVITLIGFKMFYLEGKAFPGRPLTPPIRALLITHGLMMTAWMLLSVIQPLLVATKRKRLHMTLGRIGALLAGGMIIAGVRVGIEAARLAPPNLQLFGLAPKEFMAVPVIGILAFGLFVLAGVLNRRRPEVHRPMMLMASLSVVSAALGRMPLLSAWATGTWMEKMFGAFLSMLVIAALMLAGKCLSSKSFDRWFATGFAALTVISMVISLGAKTQAWDQIASALLR